MTQIKPVSTLQEQKKIQPKIWTILFEPKRMVCLSVRTKTNLGEDVVVRDGADNREADQKHLCVGIAEGSETIILLLTYKSTKQRNGQPQRSLSEDSLRGGQCGHFWVLFSYRLYPRDQAQWSARPQKC